MKTLLGVFIFCIICTSAFAEEPVYFHMTRESTGIRSNDEPAISSQPQVNEKDKLIWTTKDFTVKFLHGFYCLINKHGSKTFTKDIYHMYINDKHYIAAIGERSELID